MVAMMREGTRTVLSMSNNYKGPTADFAMVVPVPVVLQKENVKTLPHGEFALQFGRTKAKKLLHSYGAIQSLERLLELVHDDGFILQIVIQ